MVMVLHTLVVLWAGISSLLLRILGLLVQSDACFLVQNVWDGCQGDRWRLGQRGVPHLKQKPALIDYPGSYEYQ